MNLVISLILFLILPIFGNFGVFAQEFNYERAYQDFSYNFSLYDQIKSSYTSARSEYLQYKTLTAKEKAKGETFKLLQARDEVVKTYLTSLRMKIKEHEGINDKDKESYYLRIDPEFKFFEDHKNVLSSAGSLEDLVEDSDEGRLRYENSTKIAIYTTLIAIASGKNYYFRDEIQKELNGLKSKIAEIRSNGDKDVSSIERSLTDIENKIQRSREKDSEAYAEILALKTTEKDKEETYNLALESVQQSYLYLKEVNTFLLEIVRQIKSN